MPHRGGARIPRQISSSSRIELRAETPPDTCWPPSRADSTVENPPAHQCRDAYDPPMAPVDALRMLRRLFPGPRNSSTCFSATTVRARGCPLNDLVEKLLRDRASFPQAILGQGQIVKRLGDGLPEFDLEGQHGNLSDSSHRDAIRQYVEPRRKLPASPAADNRRYL